jgi:hypothetical protein
MVFIKLEFGQFESKTKINISVDNRITIRGIYIMSENGWPQGPPLHDFHFYIEKAVSLAIVI